MLAAVGQFVAVYAMIPQIMEGQALRFTLVPLAKNLALELRVDAFGMIFALLASFLWIVVSVYSIGYMRSLKGACPDAVLLLLCHGALRCKRCGALREPAHALHVL